MLKSLFHTRPKPEKLAEPPLSGATDEQSQDQGTTQSGRDEEEDTESKVEDAQQPDASSIKSVVSEKEEEIKDSTANEEIEVTSYSGASTSRPLPQPAHSGEQYVPQIQPEAQTISRQNSSTSRELPAITANQEEPEPEVRPSEMPNEEEFENAQEDEFLNAVLKKPSTLDKLQNFYETRSGEWLTKDVSPTKSSTVHVEKKKYFKQMHRTTFVREQNTKPRTYLTGLAKHIKQFATFIPPKYRDVATAFVFQQTYHNASLITQGFLSGLSLAEAVFAFNFATAELLTQGYRWMSLPVHIVFATCFTFGCVSAYDRLGFYGWSREGISRTLSHSGTIGVVLWSIGLISSILCIKCDEELSPAMESPVVSASLLLYWRICCGLRAVAASAAWLLLALRPDCNELGETIKRCVEEEVENEDIQTGRELPEATNEDDK